MRSFLYLFSGIFVGLYLSWPGLLSPKNWKCFNEIIEKSAEDKISIKNVEDIAPETEINITIEKADGETKEIKANHSLSEEQIEWFKAGSALNSI